MTTTTPLPEREQQAREVIQARSILAENIEAADTKEKVLRGEGVLVWSLDALAAIREARRAFADAPRPTREGADEELAASIAIQQHGSYEAHPTLYSACYEGALAALVAQREQEGSPRPTSAPHHVQPRRTTMLTSQTALGYIERIEAVRAEAEEGESAILAELRAEPDYEQNQDEDLLEAIRLRAEARETVEAATTLIGAFDWIYDEAAGENVRKDAATPAEVGRG